MANELIPPKQFFDELDRSCESKIAACERQVNELAEINKELLEALKGAMPFMHSTVAKKRCAAWERERYENAKAAIAKAEQ
jgi:hypothetical protein